MLGTRHPPVARVLQTHIQRVLTAQFRKLVLDVPIHRLVDLVALHVRHRADGKFPNDFGRYDRFAAGSGKGAFDAVHGEGRVPPARHERALFVLEDSGRGAEGFVEVGHGVADGAVEGLFLVGEGRDHFHNAWDLNLAVRVDEAAEDADQVRHGLLGRAAEYAAVEVLAWTADGDAVVVAATETVCETGFFGAEPIVITDADSVGVFKKSPLFGFLFYELVQSLTAVLFHAFEAHKKVHGELDAGFAVRLDGVQPAEHGAFVVGATAAVHAAFVVDGQGEGIGGPAVILQGGLDVIVAVDEDGPFGRGGTVACYNDWWEF